MIFFKVKNSSAIVFHVNWHRDTILYTVFTELENNMQPVHVFVAIIVFNLTKSFYQQSVAAVVQYVRASSRKRKVGCSNPRRDRLEWLKPVVTTLLPNSRQYVWVSWFLGDDPHKRMYRAG